MSFKYPPPLITPLEIREKLLWIAMRQKGGTGPVMFDGDIDEVIEMAKKKLEELKQQNPNEHL